MSLKSWKEEFYPVAADSAEATATSLSATEHSLRKWRGLTEENLEKHDLIKNDKSVYVKEKAGVMPDILDINMTTCSLCATHYDYDYDYDYEHDPDENTPECEACPLYEFLGGIACDFSATQPYLLWSRGNDPKPMINALAGTLRLIKRGSR